MIRDADVAMYQAKQEGRARVAEFNELLRTEIQHRAQLEAHLHQAIANKEFMVYFQPTVSLDTRELVGFEALLRWQHPERGIVMPDEFIPVAEEIGLIIPLGAWVMEEACRQLRTWQDAGAPHLTMAINLSVRQLTAPGLVGEVSAIFKRTGVSAEDICLEVTESELMHDAEKSVSCLEGLRALGVKLAIDDFGTGYSSLSYLRRFPVDFLKIDRSFVAHLGSESEATAIVTAVVHLAHSLNLKTVAEGVETPDQEMQLKLLGCDVGQGFYWSRPLAAAELGPWFSYSGIPKASKVEEEGHRSPGDRIRVVLADDEMSHRAMVARVLERSGCFTIVGQAPDGHFAIDLAATSQPDLMILDLSMPTMGGLEALPEILSSSPRTKVVLYSGSVTRQSDRRLPSGASAFLGKSLNPDQLIEELLVVMGSAAGD
jgi:EAL domain-containing protein (putative c-di-GMP-specific phosphodiesterase class I)/ActR/RegA family two-component response regulator